MKIILATDGSAASAEADWLLARLPFTEPVDLTIANVALVPSLAHLRHEFPDSVNEMLDQYHARAESLLNEEANRFEGINGTVSTCLLSGHPAEQLVDLATERRSDLIVLGARGHTRSQRLLLGSVSLKVAKYAPCSVLVTRPSKRTHDSQRPLRILFCHDGSEASGNAAEMLARCHWGDRVEVTVLRILSPVLHYGMAVYQKSDPMWAEEKRAAAEALESAIDCMRRTTPHLKCTIREAESAADDIVDFIQQTEADLVVLGDRGMSRIERFFLGSTSENVLRYATCSVWIVRGNR